MSTRTFAVGLAIAVALMASLGVGLAVLNHGHSRPEGAAERWLTAVGDTTRKGVQADATRRAEEIGPLELADRRLVGGDTRGKAAFTDLEVGKAVMAPVGGDGGASGPTRVAFRVHTRRGADRIEVNGAMGLNRSDGRWMVSSVQLVGDKDTQGEPTSLLADLPKLPSEGGPPPSAASPSLYLGGLVGALVIGVITTALVKLAGRDAPAAVPAGAV